jgi:hypothetical protein
MAIFDRHTSCPICATPLGSEEIVAFPPFVHNRADPSSIFDDAAVHRRCLEAHPLGAVVVRACEATVEQRTPGKARCAVCHEIVIHDVFGLGYLSSDESNPLFRFNHLSFHPEHFIGWDHAERLIDELQRQTTTREWNGPSIVLDPSPHWCEPVGSRQRVVQVHRGGRDE